MEENFHKYRITGSTGRGSHGNIYRALSEEGTTVALKVLHPYLSENKKIVENFIYEAEILSKLNHPNICSFIELISEAPDYAIVMEFIDCINLKDMISDNHQNPIPFDRSIKIAKQCLLVFQYLYESQILHGDIKPSNILVDKNENIFIIDFGTAVMLSRGLDYTSGKKSSRSYCAPERLDSIKKPDIRSEIYSLGIMFLELFTGEELSETARPSEILNRHINKALTPNISEAIYKAIKKNPEQRFRDFMEFSSSI